MLRWRYSTQSSQPPTFYTAPVDRERSDWYYATTLGSELRGKGSRQILPKKHAHIHLIGSTRNPE